MTLHQLPPAQFDLARFWRTDFIRLKSDPLFAVELEKLSELWIAKAQREFRDESHVDPQLAREFLELETHAARVRVKDLPSLRQKFTGLELFPLALTIATHKFPQMRWEVLLCDDSAVIANLERSLIVDFINFDYLSGGAALVYVEDERFEGTAHQQAEADALIDAEIQADLQKLVSDDPD